MFFLSRESVLGKWGACMHNKMRFTEATLAACLAVIRVDSTATVDDKKKLEVFLERVMRGENVEGYDELPEVLSFEQTAQMLGCSKRYVYKLVSNGVLLGVYGGRNRERANGVSKQSVKRYLGY